MSTAVRYRRLVADDLPPVLALLKEAKLPTEGVEALGDNVIVASSGARIVGAAGIEMYGTDVLLRSVVVDTTWRAKGVGMELVHRALELARSSGAVRAYLLTEGASEYFERHGFRPVDRAVVTGAVAESAEFGHLCPSTAVTMVADLRRRGDGRQRS